MTKKLLEEQVDEPNRPTGPIAQPADDSVRPSDAFPVGVGLGARHSGSMVIEQLLNDWIAERNIAVDLSVAARTSRAIASEIESHFADLLARTRAEAKERTQQLAERDHSLHKALDVITRLESQLAHLRDRGERDLDRQHNSLHEKDATLLNAIQTFARIESELTAQREKLRTQLEILERDLAGKSQRLEESLDRLRQLEQEATEKERLLEGYRQKFGVIIQAVR